MAYVSIKPAIELLQANERDSPGPAAVAARARRRRGSPPAASAAAALRTPHSNHMGAVLMRHECAHRVGKRIGSTGVRPAVSGPASCLP